MRAAVAERLTQEFGPPSREVMKVKSWDVADKIGIVLQVDQPTREDMAYLWLPYPGEGQSVPDAALEYPGEAGRHSGTYPVAGLKRGEPALKLTLSDAAELDEAVYYVKAMAFGAAHSAMSPRTALRRMSPTPPPLGPSQEGTAPDLDTFIDPSSMPTAEPPKPRREPIPRLVQREVWQRDGGRCVECSTRERLCFDHIIPFSKGGGNSIRNLQLLCEGCNLSKSNRI